MHIKNKHYICIHKQLIMNIIVDKILIELYQEADNEVGSEHATITAHPVLIGLFNERKEVDYYFKFTSENGFSFEDKKEVLELFTKIEQIIEQAK